MIFIIHHAWQQRLADVTLVCIMVAGVRHFQSTGRWWGRPTLKIVYLKAGQFKSSLVTTDLKKDCCREQCQCQPCMPHWAACFRHRGEIVKLHPIYINTCKTPKIEAGLNAKVRHQLQRPPMKVNSSSGKNL